MHQKLPTDLEFIILPIYFTQYSLKHKMHKVYQALDI